MSPLELENHAITRIVMLGTSRKFDHMLKTEYFSPINGEIYNALRTYESQTGASMDASTFVMQFPDFAWSPSETQVEWFADEMQQNYVASAFRKLAEDAEAGLEDDPRGVVRNLQSELIKLAPYTSTVMDAKVGLVAHAADRATAMERRAVVQGLAGATTGFALLDRDTHGTGPGDIELYVARPGIGKTWTLIYGGYMAWREQKKKISIVSPEMNAHEVGLRLDAFHLHISHMRMQSGNMTPNEIEAYRELTTEWREKMPHDIIFRDTVSIGRRFTTADLRRIIDEDECDLLLLDGLLFIDPAVEPQKSRDVRSRLTQVMDEIKSASTQMQVAIRAAHQVNREIDQMQSRSKKKQNEAHPCDAIPYLHHLAEAGATEQYANRVIALSYNEGRMYYAVRKNRGGPDKLMFSTQYDIDTGDIYEERVETGEVQEAQPQQQTLGGKTAVF